MQSLLRPTLMEVTALEKSFTGPSGRLHVVGGVEFLQEKGEFLAIVGPSGCGKSTLLRLLSGLTPPDSGSVRHQGRSVTEPPDWISVVFQDYRRSLFPWLKVHDNVMLGAKRARRGADGSRSRAQLEVAVEEALSQVNLQDFGDYYPWQLSGGMQQRVALARAIAAQPELLILDEPFASVDAQTRMSLQDLVMSLWERLDMAVLLVTHDIEEAILMADRILVVSPRPTHVAHVIEVDLPRPRDQVGTKGAPRFAQLRGELYGYLTSPSND